jgi:hypothetical protein
VVSAPGLTAANLGSLDRSRYFFIRVAPTFAHEAEWTPFQTHCFSENMVAPGIERETFGPVARHFDHYTKRWSTNKIIN